MGQIKKRKFFKGMGRLLCLVFLLALTMGCTGQADKPQDPKEERTITDMAGRQVKLKGEVKKIYGTDPAASSLIYMVNADKLAGWNYAFNDQEKAFILTKYQDLPVFGMGDAVNLEALIKTGPQLCLQAGGTGTAEIEKADKLQQQLGIPVVVVDSALKAAPAAFTLLGDLMGEKDRGQALSDYAGKLLAKAEALKPTAEQQKSIYYGNGAESLETAPPKSASAQVFSLLKTDNVAKVESPTGGRIQISVEQLISWDPEYIFVNGEPKKNLSGSGAAQAIKTGKDFSTLRAVKEGKVYSIPKSPFSWVGRPTGANQLMGLAWIGNLLYPEQFNDDMNEAVRNFYHLFYHLELTDEQITGLYGE